MDLQRGWILNAAAKGTLDHGPPSKVSGCKRCRCRVVRFCVTVDIVRDGGRRNVGVRTCAVWPLPWKLELVPHASAQPSAATASAIISSGRDGSVASDAASFVQPSAATPAGTCRSRASITATSTSSRCNSADYIDFGLCYGLASVRDRVFTCNRVCRSGDSGPGSTLLY